MSNVEPTAPGRWVKRNGKSYWVSSARTCPEPGGCVSCPDPHHCRRGRIKARLTTDGEEREAGLEPRNHWAIRLRLRLLRSGSHRWTIEKVRDVLGDQHARYDPEELMCFCRGCFVHRGTCRPVAGEHANRPAAAAGDKRMTLLRKGNRRLLTPHRSVASVPGTENAVAVVSPRPGRHAGSDDRPCPDLANASSSSGCASGRQAKAPRASCRAVAMSLHNPHRPGCAPHAADPGRNFPWR